MPPDPGPGPRLAFATPLTLTGPRRQPRQLLEHQDISGHTSIHDGDTADSLGLTGAPIEGPTHLSQFDPLAHAIWGDDWFATGCLSAHFRTMVVEGEEVTASLTTIEGSPSLARITAVKPDGAEVLAGTASVGAADETELGARLARLGDPGELFILDRLEVGQRVVHDEPVSIDLDTPNGPLYPFSLAQKLAVITEPSPWYTSSDNPWGRPILPFEMVSVLGMKVAPDLPVRGPALGLFLDLEVRMEGTPLFVGQEYRLEREVVGLGQSRRTESNWVRTSFLDAGTGERAATMLLHSGVFKESYAGYPKDRL